MTWLQQNNCALYRAMEPYTPVERPPFSLPRRPQQRPAEAAQPRWPARFIPGDLVGIRPGAKTVTPTSRAEAGEQIGVATALERRRFGLPEGADPSAVAGFQARVLGKALEKEGPGAPAGALRALFDQLEERLEKVVGQVPQNLANVAESLVAASWLSGDVSEGLAEDVASVIINIPHTPHREQRFWTVGDLDEITLWSLSNALLANPPEGAMRPGISHVDLSGKLRPIQAIVDDLLVPGEHFLVLDKESGSIVTVGAAIGEIAASIEGGSPIDGGLLGGVRIASWGSSENPLRPNGEGVPESVLRTSVEFLDELRKSASEIRAV